MSEMNRRNEYNRLIKLDRAEDICKSLIAEFGKVPNAKSKTPLPKLVKREVTKDGK